MPKKNQLHVDQVLSNVSIRYRNEDYIAMDMFPTIPVKKDTDLYRIFERNFRIPETERADGALANRHDFNVSTASYSLEKHALKDYVSDSQEDNYDMASLRVDTTEELTDVIMRRVEKHAAGLFTTTSWSLNVSLAAAGQWSANTTVSNPIPIVDTGATTVIANSGFKPNKGILPRSGFIAAKNHVSVLDRTKYTSSAMTREILAGLFDLETLMVPTASEDTAAEGQSASISAIWGDNMLLYYTPARPSPRLPSAGYIFKKNKPAVRRWREEEREAEAIEVSREWVHKVVASLAGYLIRDTNG